MAKRRLTAVLSLAVGLVLLGATTPGWADDVDGDEVDDAIDVCNNTPPDTAVDAEGRPLGDVDQDCDNDLDDYALSQQGFTGPLVEIIDCNENGIPDDVDIADGTSDDLGGPAGMVPDGVPDECYPDCQPNGLPDFVDLWYGLSDDVNANGIPDECEGNLPVVIDTVTVGNPENANDTHDDGYGGVDYVYNIGKFEVTAGQYTAFLNAVADEDTYGLYNQLMDVDSGISEAEYGCNIKRTGSSPNYSYSVADDWADRPVNNVSWGDAARFANWLHNGQPTGSQDLTITEDGSYYLNGAMTSVELVAVVREPDATWVIPSEDEWYKAAYHKNDGVTGNYFDYPTSSDIVPGYVNDSSNLYPAGTPFTGGGTDPGNYVTYNGDVGTFATGPPYYRTVVGEWENSESPYGTFDQAGNVTEWNEAIKWCSLCRGINGGSFRNPVGYLLAGGTNSMGATVENLGFGFRVAEVP